MSNESEEEYTTPASPCKKCGKPDVWFWKDETFDGAYDRYNYHCHACDYRWRVVDESD